MKKRKRIALLVGQADENYQKLFIEGFLKQGFDYDYDVCVFSMYQKYQENSEREIGDSSIYSLINYEMFDGVVLLLDTIQTPGVADKIEKQLHQSFKGPVLVVDKESKYFPTIKTDSYTAIKKIISHLIEDHGYEDIAFLTGKKWHNHSKERLQAYIDCMEEHNLPIRKDRMFYGDYWYSSGETMVENLLRDRENMPRAIACANDCMAIGVGQALERNGLRVPEDVALVGYDSVEEGRMSPKPITSVPIPAREIGMHAAVSMTALFEGEEVPEFCIEPDLFVGSSCGCHNESIIPRLNVREDWSTELSSGSFFSCYNHMVDDMLCQSDFNSMIDTVYSYLHQIGTFESFYLCLNSQWCDMTELTEKEGHWKGYTEQILPVIVYDRNMETHNQINCERMFGKSLLLPALHEEREQPRAFFFTPLYFEELCMGYAAISYGDEIRSYDDTYRLWIRTVMQGLECFRRMEELQQSNNLLISNQIRDTLTGLYNYQGLLQQADVYFDKCVSVMVVDIKALSRINECYGREEGNRAIAAVARMLDKCVEGGVSCRLGNGEFISIVPVKDLDDKYIYNVKGLLIDQLAELKDFIYELSVYTGCEIGVTHNLSEFESLINLAVTQKNGNKLRERKMLSGTEMTKEEKQEAACVESILDKNQLYYHFQPIVDAKNGDIYAYEALMRGDVSPTISPLKILKYAEHLERLYDVERYTFFNVLEQMHEQQSLIKGRKIFINSIPGNQLQDKDVELLEEKMKDFSGCVVVELTEQTELSDDKLVEMKEQYAKMGIDTAVDDYGAGYSNVTNLLRYMPNYVKIDRMLMSEIQNSPQKQHFVREIIEFAHSNNIKALAEGVETTEELHTVIHLGVDLIQGYYTGRPQKEFIREISKEIKEEIIHYQNQEIANKSRRIYVAGKERRISLSRLVSDQYISIEVLPNNVVYQDITIVGVPGKFTDLNVDIKDGYHGKITLENVSFAANKNKMCINLGENCEVTLLLQGDNYLTNGGIRVPESSGLRIEGSGHLYININKDDYFGIGNDVDSTHGVVILEQDGTIEINANGRRGVAIGSGYGGKIDIRAGIYNLDVSGENGVCIGSLEGMTDINITTCGINLTATSVRNAGIGSLAGTLKLYLEHATLKGIFGGVTSVGIGSLEGNADIKMFMMNLNFNLRSDVITAIGSINGDVLIDILKVNIVIKVDGKEALGFGNHKLSAKIRIFETDVNSKVKTALDTDIGAQEDDMDITEGRFNFILNGMEIVRWVEE